MYTLKSIAQRGTTLLAAIALAVGTVLPAIIPSGAAFADALNPLTKRSLTLSSSSPGWSYTDGSGNITYAPPNSGANGQKTGNTFSFNVSTDSSSTGTNKPIKTMSFQYCTTSAGNCTAPGNDAVTAGAGTITTDTTDTNVTGTGTNFTTAFKVGSVFTTAGGHAYTVATIATDTAMTITTTPTVAESGVAYSYRGDGSSTSDLNVVTNSPSEVAPADFNTVVASDGNVQAVPAGQNNAGTYPEAKFPRPNTIGGNYVVYYSTNGGTSWTQSTGWTMSTANVENGGAGDTGKNNYIILTNGTGLGVPTNATIKVVFFGTDQNYITNPGAGAFFVKINTYDQKYVASSPTAPDVNLTGLEPASDANVIDGGVTVANVMNQSIQITTKVLETMQFSVGTVDPDTLSDTNGGASTPSAFEAAIGQAADNNATKHGTCNPVVTGMTPTDPANTLQLGNQNAESSLSTDHTYITHSYWRLSSNSSAGATVYYSGHTLTNTEGDAIKPIGASSAAPTQGSEQFGLAIANGTSAPYSVDYTQETGTGNGSPFENAADNGLTTIDPSTLTDMTVSAGPPVVYNASWHSPQLAPLVPVSAYADGSGTVNGGSGTAFAFDPTSDTIPVSIASESTAVVDCVTAKMRYIANIAATTPAGIYTTKVNYIAAPQY